LFLERRKKFQIFFAKASKPTENNKQGKGGKQKWGNEKSVFIKVG
jgi:hypothetical protein